MVSCRTREIDVIAMQPAFDDLSPWGTYAAHGGQHLWRALVRLGVSHGGVKKRLAARWRAAYGEAPVDLRYDGVRFRLHPWDNTVEARLLFGSRSREALERRVMRAHLHAGAFVDIGANVGFYALFAAAAGARQVIAVEPNPAALQRLRFNVQANGWNDRITVVPVALDSSAGEAVLVHGTDLGGGALAGAGQPGAQRLSVATSTLPALLHAQGVTRVAVLKIDVEGMEDRVLLPLFDPCHLGLRPRLLIVEHVHQQHWRHDLFARLSAQGYRLIARTSSNTLLRMADDAPAGSTVKSTTRSAGTQK